MFIWFDFQASYLYLSEASSAAAIMVVEVVACRTRTDIGDV